MVRTVGIAAILVFSLVPAATIPSQEKQIVVRAKNDLASPRPSETIDVSAKEILKLMSVTDWKAVHVTDAASGQEPVCQAVDLEGDGAVDSFLFQSDFKPREERSFFLRTGAARIPAREQFKAYGRFVRERYDDFAWENDRIAHRMYGLALETWQAEPLTSSAVDVWCKRTRRLVINDWYMMDNYHADSGEGADFYSAGRSRGCGGSGVWEGGKLFVSRNFIDSKVIANGPVRVVFELTYPAWEVNGRKISEVKRISLDAGQNFDRFESRYKSVPDGPIATAIGIKKQEGSNAVTSRAEGWIRTWEPVQEGKSGNLGCGIIVDPAAIVEFGEADGNYLVITSVAAGRPASYHAGFGWDRSGDFANVSDWESYLKQFAQRVRSPLRVTVSLK